MSINTFKVTNSNIALYNPSNPGGTTSATPVQMGLAMSFTPKMTGKIKMTLSGYISNNTLSGVSVIQLSYGTGTAPTNGSAATGTQQGNGLAMQITGATVQACPFCQIWYASGLTLYTAYWIDATVEDVGGISSASISSLNCIVEEIQN